VQGSECRAQGLVRVAGLDWWVSRVAGGGGCRVLTRTSSSSASERPSGQSNCRTARNSACAVAAIAWSCGAMGEELCDFTPG